MIKATFYQNGEHFSAFSTIARDIVDKQAPVKQKVIRGNNAPFMNKELSKAIMNRSRVKNRYLKESKKTKTKKAKKSCLNFRFI